MHLLGPIDWHSIFYLNTPLLEIFVRGSIMYLGAFVLLRVILRRQSGTLNTSDVLILVMIADAAQNGMADDYKSITDGLLLVSTLLFWNFLIDWMSYHFDWFGRLVSSPPNVLVRHGKMLLPHMRRELITKDELLSQLRAAGVEDIRKVKLAAIESNGELSVIKKE